MRARQVWVLLLALLVAACAQFGLEAPKSVSDRIAYANSNLTAVYNHIPSLIERGRITKEQGAKLVKEADTVRDGLDAARAALGAGDTDTAIGKLQVAQALLASLEAYLKVHQ